MTKPEFSSEYVRQMAVRMRRMIVTMAADGATSHVGSALSCVDILAVLYSGIMNVSPQNWQTPAADRFILSKGHGAKAWYAALTLAGFFPEELLKDYARDGSLLGEHPSHQSVPGILFSTGSLGHGLSVAAGMALGKRMKGAAGRVYTIVSDGECNEGSIWEAAMFAAHHRLDNLTVIVDDNQWQALGPSREVSALEPFADKWRAFGWETAAADGHDAAAVHAALTAMHAGSGRPKVLIARTVLGKGVSFMEDDLLWHYQVPSAQQLALALQELSAS